jgi:hypothetical protein
MTELQIFALLAPLGLVFLVGAFVFAEEYFNQREMRLEKQALNERANPS